MSSAAVTAGSDVPAPAPATYLVPDAGSASLSWQLPPGVDFDLEAVYVVIDASGAGTAVTAELTITDVSGQVIAKKPQTATIPAAGSGSATFALRLSDDAAVDTTGLHWGSNTDTTHLGLVLNGHGAFNFETGGAAWTNGTSGGAYTLDAAQGNVTIESLGADIGQLVKLQSGGQITLLANSQLLLTGGTTILDGLTSLLIESPLVQTVTDNIEEKFQSAAGTWRVANAAGVSLLEVTGAGAVSIPSTLNMGSHKVTNVTDPTAAQDAATKAYVDTTAGGAVAIATNTFWTAKGQLAVASASGAASPLTVGSNGLPLVADSGQTLGVKYGTISEPAIALTDVTTDNVTSAAHGFAPKAPNNSAVFLNGANPPAYAAVTDANLSTSDITTNDVSTAKHGFVPKALGGTAKFLREDATWSAVASVPAGSAIVGTDAIWDAKGDLAAATGADAAVRVAAGTDGQVLQSDSTATAGVSWVGGTVKLYDFTVTGAAQAAIDTFVDNGGHGTSALLPTTFAVLEFYYYVRTDDASSIPSNFLRFNNDSGGNYDKEALRDINASVSSGPGLAATGFTVYSAGAGADANVFGSGWFVFPNYGNTANHKTGNANIGTMDSVGAHSLTEISTMHWRSTAAISRIAITPQTAGKKLQVGSRLIVYGR